MGHLQNSGKQGRPKQGTSRTTALRREVQRESSWWDGRLAKTTGPSSKKNSNQWRMPSAIALRTMNQLGEFPRVSSVFAQAQTHLSFHGIAEVGRRVRGELICKLGAGLRKNRHFLAHISPKMIIPQSRPHQGVDEAGGWILGAGAAGAAGDWASREMICWELGSVEESQPPPTASINCTLATICWTRRFTAVC